jgi:hypothetical protein
MHDNEDAGAGAGDDTNNNINNNIRARRADCHVIMRERLRQ